MHQPRQRDAHGVVHEDRPLSQDQYVTERAHKPSDAFPTYGKTAPRNPGRLIPRRQYSDPCRRAR